MQKIAILLVFVAITFLAYQFAMTSSRKSENNYGLGAIPAAQKLSEQYCQDKNGNKLSYMEALEIAQLSDCTNQPDALTTFTQKYQCNETTGTLWIDLNVDPKPSGCSPACVVNLFNKTAEINWRCTGVVDSK